MAVGDKVRVDVEEFYSLPGKTRSFGFCKKKNGKGCCVKIIYKFVNCAKNWVVQDKYFSGPNFESVVSCSQFSKYNESTTNIQIHFEKLITSLHSFT